MGVSVSSPGRYHPGVMDTKPSSRSAITALLLALILAILPLSHAAGKEPATASLLLLHVNDIHSHLLPDDKGIGGLARIGGYVEQVRSERNDVLFLDAGDGVTGTPVSSIFRGRPVFHVMSAASPRTSDRSTLWW